MKLKIARAYIALTVISFVIFLVSRFTTVGDSSREFFNLYFVVVTMMFNIIVITVYSRHRKVVIYSVLSMINVVGFFSYMTYFSNNLMGIILGFIIPLTFLSAVSSIFVAFWIILSEKFMVFFGRVLMAISINNYIFYTVYVTRTEQNIIGFFGPFPEDLDIVFTIFYMIRDFNLTFIVALQTILLYYLASGKKFWNYKRVSLEGIESKVEYLEKDNEEPEGEPLDIVKQFKR